MCVGYGSFELVFLIIDMWVNVSIDELLLLFIKLILVYYNGLFKNFLPPSFGLEYAETRYITLTGKVSEVGDVLVFQLQSFTVFRRFFSRLADLLNQSVLHYLQSMYSIIPCSMWTGK